MGKSGEWDLEIAEAGRSENWRPTGPQRPIKVCPAERSLEFDVGGYFTVGKFLLGKTPTELEAVLGLPRRYLDCGARMYKFVRLPHVNEYSYELTTAYPDGLADRGAFPHKPYYPAGSPTVHQWKILPGKWVPVEREYYTLRPGFRLPYAWLVKS